MRSRPLSRRRRHLLTCLLLVMLLRAYVPAGFMPQSGRLLQLEVCPAGLPSHTMMSHAMMPHAMMPHAMMPHAMAPAPGSHSTGSGAHVTDWCFGCSPTAGPIVDGVVLASVQPVLSLPPPAFDTRPAGTLTLRAHQARAPPALA